MIVVDVFALDSLQVPLVEDDHVVETLTSNGGVVAPLWLRAKSAYGGCAFYLFIRAHRT